MGRTDEIRRLAEPALASAGLELWDVQLERDVLRILVDKPGGVDLEALTAASRVVSPLLDQHPEVEPEGRYQLEVSSPGLERTLRTREQFQRYIGSEITVKTNVPVEGARRHHGTLLSADETGIRLQPKDSTGDEPVELGHDQIERARTVLVWGPAPSPSARRASAKRPVAARAGTPASGTATEAAPGAAPDSKDTGS
jgi:ribosome maturation factor RimP